MKTSNFKVFVNSSLLLFIHLTLLGTMAALQLTILSDDEDESSNNSKGSSVGKKRKQQTHTKHEDTDTSNEDESADEMDGNFEFGGLLVSVIIYI